VATTQFLGDSLQVLRLSLFILAVEFAMTMFLTVFAVIIEFRQLLVGNEALLLFLVYFFVVIVYLGLVIEEMVQLATALSLRLHGRD
jgi:hypothetical protein